jgi:hypothetical protein
MGMKKEERGNKKVARKHGVKRVQGSMDGVKERKAARN